MLAMGSGLPPPAQSPPETEGVAALGDDEVGEVQEAVQGCRHHGEHLELRPDGALRGSHRAVVHRLKPVRMRMAGCVCE